MTKLETSYGVFRAQNRINPRWIDFDKDLANVFGLIVHTLQTKFTGGYNNGTNIYDISSR